jgi:hypothetical protein
MGLRGYGMRSWGSEARLGGGSMAIPTMFGYRSY